MRLDWKAILISMVATTVCLLVIMMMKLWVTDDWSFLDPATCWPNCFNEAVYDGHIKQPWNTVSSLAYFAVGIYILCLPYSRQKTKTLDVRSNRALRWIFAIAAMVTGLGSIFLHMSLSFIGQTFDVLGMYLLSVFLIIYTFRGVEFNMKKFIIWYVASILVLLAILILLPDLRRYLFAVMIIIGLIIEYIRHRMNRDSRNLWAATGVLAFGFLFWVIDGTTQIFDPYSWLQGHVLWHVFGAMAIGLLYAYYVAPKRLN